ncbi:MAG: succinylglutamate desuccinylase/aspartoacylase family protein [Oligoflexales bacterium]|nr:succinylglutamate desuccinylase/aspartoacylase family protein [Oligoflexales bacterium]
MLIVIQLLIWILRKMINFSFNDQLDRFYTQLKILQDKGYLIEKKEEDIFILTPTIFSKNVLGGQKPSQDQKKTDLAVMAITHGNEVAGLAVLAAWLELLVNKCIELECRVALILGNLPAASQNKRFLEADLNRSFGRDICTLAEHRRAKNIMPYLANTTLLLDIHQTSSPSLCPFFIFPFRKKALHFARAVNSQIPIVTHWGDSFSKDGMCTDEYVNSKGGIGLTIELGKNGFDPYQISTGVLACVQASHYAAKLAKGQNAPSQNEEMGAMGPLLNFKHIEPWPSSGQLTLRPGLHNFMAIEKFELLGTNPDGTEHRASTEGLMMFPKYLTDSSQKVAPSEAYRLLGFFKAEELPDID